MSEPADTPDSKPSRYPADTSMIEVLAQFAARGFDGHFDVDEDTGGCRCEQCGTSSAAADIDAVDSRRLEGASDPADMSSVMAMPGLARPLRLRPACPGAKRSLGPVALARPAAVRS
jgi:hypothetical protein